MPGRVLHVVSSTTFAGIERHVLALARELPQHGWSAAVACPKRALKLREASREAGVAVVPEKDSRTSWAALVGTARLRGFDIVHIHDGHSALAVAPLLIAGRTPVVRTQHFAATATTHRGGAASRLSGAVHHALNERLATYIGVSRVALEAARERGELGQVPVAVIPPGIELLPENRFEAAMHRRALRSACTVGFVGRLEPEKRVDVFIRAMPTVLAAHPGTTFVIAGSGSAEAELRALAAELHVEASLRFESWTSDPLTVMEDLDIYVNPWPDEGYGMAMAEAMSCGLVVVAPDAGASPELVEDRVTGRLVTALDPASLSAAVVALARDPAARAGCGRQARDKVEAHSVRSVATAIARAYAENDGHPPCA